MLFYPSPWAAVVVGAILVPSLLNPKPYQPSLKASVTVNKRHSVFFPCLFYYASFALLTVLIWFAGRQPEGRSPSEQPASAAVQAARA